MENRPLNYDTNILFVLSSEDKKAFKIACFSNLKNQSQVLRELVREYIDKNKQK